MTGEPPCKILVVHNRYRQPGGEDAVVQAETEMLRAFGHQVELYERDNREIDQEGRLALAAQTIWSRQTVSDVGSLVTRLKPDLVHAHNTFPLVSPSLYWAAASMGVPVVQTLHNFRLACLQAMFLRDQAVCEDCLGRAPWRGVLRRCYRASTAASAVLAVTLVGHRALGTFQRKISRYICLSNFCRGKFIEAGIPGEQISVKPNFLPDPGVQSERLIRRSGALFVGRLAPEKGIGVLAAASQQAGVSLKVVGDGPERTRLEGRSDVQLCGWQSQQAVQAAMRAASYLVVPSIWFEAFGMVVIEAFANGLPVIASRIGSLAEMVTEGVTGLLFQPGSVDDLAGKLRWAESHPEAVEEMGASARRVYLLSYTPEKNYSQLLAIYGQVLNEKGRRESLSVHPTA